MLALCERAHQLCFKAASQPNPKQQIIWALVCDCHICNHQYPIEMTLNIHWEKPEIICVFLDYWNANVQVPEWLCLQLLARMAAMNLLKQSLTVILRSQFDRVWPGMEWVDRNNCPTNDTEKNKVSNVQRLLVNKPPSSWGKHDLDIFHP